MEFKSFDSNNLTEYLNQSDENYEIYSKIYNSITSTFEKYNLTDNETDYLKFYILYYLNHFGNCTDYEWNESDEFENFRLDYALKCMVLSACYGGSAEGSASAMPIIGSYFIHSTRFSVPLAIVASNVTENNATDVNNSTYEVSSYLSDDYSWIVILVLILFAIIFII